MCSATLRIQQLSSQSREPRWPCSKGTELLATTKLTTICLVPAVVAKADPICGEKYVTVKQEHTPAITPALRKSCEAQATITPQLSNSTTKWSSYILTQISLQLAIVLAVSLLLLLVSSTAYPLSPSRPTRRPWQPSAWVSLPLETSLLCERIPGVSTLAIPQIPYIWAHAQLLPVSAL